MTIPRTPDAEPQPVKPKGIQVTVTDLENGETNIAVIWDDYCIITAGSAYVDYVQSHANGTQQLTVKGVRRRG